MRRTLILVLSLATPAVAEPVPPGRYEITAWLELPHLERWVLPVRRELCLGVRDAALPAPLVAAPKSADGCSVTSQDGARFRLDCPGRDGTRGLALYHATPDGFAARIDLVLGAKNMTMTEVQRGIRLGDCTATGG